jgi:hypothetical protein
VFSLWLGWFFGLVAFGTLRLGRGHVFNLQDLIFIFW